MSATTSIVTNQRRAYLASATDDARNLIESLKSLSEPQRAAIIATIAKASHTPVDITMQADLGDEVEVYMIVDGILARGAGPYVWKLDSGCTFVVDVQEGSRYE